MAKKGVNMLFGLFGRRTRSLKEIDAEFINLVANRDAISPQLLPQINTEINIKMIVLNVLKWYLKDKSILKLSFSNETIKHYEEIVRKNLAENQK